MRLKVRPTHRVQRTAGVTEVQERHRVVSGQEPEENLTETETQYVNSFISISAVLRPPEDIQQEKGTLEFTAIQKNVSMHLILPGWTSFNKKPLTPCSPTRTS